MTTTHIAMFNAHIALAGRKLCTIAQQQPVVGGRGRGSGGVDPAQFVGSDGVDHA